MIYKYSDVLEIFNSSRCKLISREEDFKNTRSTVEFICGECDLPSKMMFSTFKNGKPKMCAKCRVKNRKFSRETNIRYDQKSVEELYRSHGCEFLGNYTYNNESYDFICSCGTPDRKLFYQFRKTPMCKKCAKDKADSDRIHPIEEVKEYLESIGCTLLDEEYKGIKHKINFICKNGHPASNTLDAIKVTNNGHCRECQKEFHLFNRGENHYKWKGGTYTSESLKFRTSYEFKKWRQDVFKRDGHSCTICGLKGHLNAHHKDGYNWCEEKRTDVNNGVTLCVECHEEFHMKYGYGDNSESQFEEFCESKASLV